METNVFELPDSFDKCTDIDILNLDKEFLRQGNLYRKYSKLEASARQMKGNKKLELEVYEAKLDKEIRDTTEVKLTETAIKNMILSDEKRISLIKELNIISYNMDVLTGALKALEHKKSALENLSFLWAREYFVIPKNTPKMVDRLSSEQKKALNRNKEINNE